MLPFTTKVRTDSEHIYSRREKFTGTCQSLLNSVFAVQLLVKGVRQSGRVQPDDHSGHVTESPQHKTACKANKGKREKRKSDIQNKEIRDKRVHVTVQGGCLLRCGETQDSGRNELRQQMPRGCSCPRVQLLNPFWCPPPLTQGGLAVGLERVRPKSHTHATGNRMLWLCRAERKHHYTRAFILACVSLMHRSTALRLGYAPHGDFPPHPPPLPSQVLSPWNFPKPLCRRSWSSQNKRREPL